MYKTLLFIPMYNCEKQITRVLDQINDEVLQYISEVIVVNNISTDNGESIAIDYCLNHKYLPIKIIRNDKNYGLGGSHKVAFDYAQNNDFDYIVVLHGDDQGNIKDLLPYLKDGSAYKYDSFLGSRFEKESKLVNYSAFRIFGNKVFNIFMSICLGQKITDLGSGLNMYNVKYLESKFYMAFIDNLTFNVYMLIYGVYSKSYFSFFSLTWREDDQISNAKFFKQAKEIFQITIKYVFNKRNAFPTDTIENKYTYKIVYSNK